MRNRNRWWAAGLVAVALGAAACGSTSTTPAASGGQPSAAAPSGGGSSSSALTTAKISGVTVLTNSKGFTLYWFAPDTATTSHCAGSCAQFWPPVKGPVTVPGSVNGQVGMITRADGSTQATYDGHPLYTYKGDTSPGQNSGNGANASGGLWHEVTASGAAPSSSPSSSSSSGSGGYGY
jgi:predicted lipoprotein with Yx(FWY)xxD motif